MRNRSPMKLIKNIRINGQKSENPPIGLGDAVKILAQPIAKTVDALTGMIGGPFATHLSNCGGCEKRAQKLNDLVPNIPLT